jgi:hypothetical protein
MTQTELKECVYEIIDTEPTPSFEGLTLGCKLEDEEAFISRMIKFKKAKRKNHKA